MPLLPYDYLHLVNCPEVVTISDILCNPHAFIPSPEMSSPLQFFWSFGHPLCVTSLAGLGLGTCLLLTRDFFIRSVLNSFIEIVTVFMSWSCHCVCNHCYAPMRLAFFIFHEADFSIVHIIEADLQGYQVFGHSALHRILYRWFSLWPFSCEYNREPRF